MMKVKKRREYKTFPLSSSLFSFLHFSRSMDRAENSFTFSLLSFRHFQWNLFTFHRLTTQRRPLSIKDEGEAENLPLIWPCFKIKSWRQITRRRRLMILHNFSLNYIFYKEENYFEWVGKGSANISYRPFLISHPSIFSNFLLSFLWLNCQVECVEMLMKVRGLTKKMNLWFFYILFIFTRPFQAQLTEKIYINVI